MDNMLKHISSIKAISNKTTLVRYQARPVEHQIHDASLIIALILGDPLYNSSSKVSRLMLHAFRLSCTHHSPYRTDYKVLLPSQILSKQNSKQNG